MQLAGKELYTVIVYKLARHFQIIMKPFIMVIIFLNNEKNEPSCCFKTWSYLAAGVKRRTGSLRQDGRERLRSLAARSCSPARYITRSCAASLQSASVSPSRLSPHRLHARLHCGSENIVSRAKKTDTERVRHERLLCSCSLNNALDLHLNAPLLCYNTKHWQCQPICLWEGNWSCTTYTTQWKRESGIFSVLSCVWMQSEKWTNVPSQHCNQDKYKSP